MRAWMSIAPPGGLGTTRLTVRVGKFCAVAVPSATSSSTAPNQDLGIIGCIVNSPHAVRPRQGRAREALRWEHAAALAAEARALCALRHRMAGAVVRSRARAGVPRRAQGRCVEEGS